MKKILRLLGLVTVSELDSSIKSKDELIESQKKQIADFEKFFDKPEPTMSYEEFVISKGLEESRFGHKHWNDYWAACYQAKYMSFYFIEIAKHPELLNGLLVAIAEFPWQKCAQNYKERNWYWGDRTDRTPTVLEMVDSVISLMHSGLVSESAKASEDLSTGGGWSSGGFSISWENNVVLIKNDTLTL